MAKSKVEYWLTDDGLILLEGWARDGLTDEQIAHNCGISRNTLYVWQNKHQDIRDALKKGKEVIDYEIENQLIKNIKGFEHTYLTEKVTKDGDVVSVMETVYVKPDTAAAIFWLKNRLPKKWRNNPSADDGSSNGDKKVIIIDDL